MPALPALRHPSGPRLAGAGRRAACLALSVLLLGLSARDARPVEAQTCPAGAVRIAPGTPIQAKVNLAPPGTTFCIGAGIHRLQRIAPKDNQVFLGEAGAVLNGAVLLDRFRQENGLWVARTGRPPTPAPQADAICLKSRPACRHSERVLIDDVPLEPVERPSEVRPGSFSLDRATGEVHLAEDPRGRRVELAVVPYAVWHNAARDVTVKGLTVEKYASPAQHGAIYGDEHERASGWLIEGNDVRLNSGAGIAVGSGGVVRNNRVHRNGQLGISPNGSGVLVEDNEISENNTHGYAAGWEAGGLKGGQVEHLTLRRNNVHDNYGSGLWCDVDCRHVLIEHNLVERNADAGIFYEISYDAIIRNNVVRLNGTGRGGQQGSVWFWGAGIQIAASERVEVYDNVVTVAEGGTGIILIDQGRPFVGRGEGLYKTRDNVVRGNRVQYLGSSGTSGGASDVGPTSPNHGIIETGRNRFDGNTYELVRGGSGRSFIWGGEPLSADQFRAAGQEQHGTISWREQGH